ncbi:hypothetical protein ACQUW5_13640 [Legionella sp. CNM-1927-20]|uniref:hypothetical protein n=1 Tax=Legionella sp. CNM-1927-20 TaxID=3422221 RepID=UPI00403AB5F8
MKQLFFSANSISSEGKEASFLEEIRRINEALLQYNRNLYTQLRKSKIKEEIFEIICAMYCNLSQLPEVRKVPDNKIFEEVKAAVLQGLREDVARYTQYKIYLERNQIDELYLSMRLTAQFIRTQSQSSNTNTVEYLFSFFYTGKELKKKVRQACNGKHISPVMAEYLELQKTIKLLEPLVSSACLKFEEEVKCVDAQIVENGRIREAGRIDTGNIKLEKSKTYKRARKYLEENPHPSNPIYIQLKSLIEKYKECLTSKESQQGNPSKDLHDNYIALFNRIKPKYALEAEIDSLLKMAVEEKTIAVQVAEDKSHLRHSKQAEHGLIHQHSELTIGQTQSTTSTATLEDKTSGTNLTVVSEFASGEVMEVREQKEEASMAENADAGIEDKSPEEEEEEVVEERIEELGLAKSEQTGDNLIGKDKFYTSYSKQTQKHNTTKKVLPETKYNVLNLKEEHQETLKKVFDLLEYKTMSLRELVSLAFALGGKLTSTGANRCRLEIENIYAHLLVDRESIEVASANLASTATVTWHGGGHRSTRSQNSAKGVPNYLIEQFRSAFERAGYTPKNLGLNVTTSPNRNCK